MARWPRMSNSFKNKPKTYSTTTGITTSNSTGYDHHQRNQQNRIRLMNDYQQQQSTSSSSNSSRISAYNNEPVYQDVSNDAIERSRSLQSLTIQDQNTNRTRIHVNYE